MFMVKRLTKKSYKSFIAIKISSGILYKGFYVDKVLGELI